MSNLCDTLFLIKGVYSKCINPLCKKYDLNQMEFSILLLLSENPKLDTAQKIVDTYHLSKSHVSTSLNNLERKGYLKRMREEGKRKNVSLLIMEKGGIVIKDGEKSLRELEKTITLGIPDVEINLIEKIFETVNLNMKEFLTEK